MPGAEDLVQLLENRPIAYAYVGEIYIVDNTESPPMASDRPKYHIYMALVQLDLSYVTPMQDKAARKRSSLG
jgi:hypothetical protein